jgi:DNA-binding NtrC family response regulator
MMITGYATIEGAIQAVKIGAEEYLPKPFTDEELFSAVDRAMVKLQKRREIVHSNQKSLEAFAGIIGISDAMQQVFRSIKKAATTSATVLITGESGTGKELVARAIHYNSARSAAPFVPVNCAGIPEALLESELFGYVRGAFTGANETRAGFFQTADGGTIFFDEINSTTQAMQVKLLRVLQEREVYMIGARKPQHVDVRVIAATNRDLLGLVKKEIFRADLYYRLNVVIIDIPPLRERRDDILLLTKVFAKKYAEEMSKAIPDFSENARDALQHYAWPGNVRELENVIQRLIVMVDHPRIEVSDLPTFMRFSAPHEIGLNITLDEAESRHIRQVIESVQGNKSRAADILGIDRKTLREKMKRAGIEA